jgi:3-oxoacyl-[acyl-carrier protein] reductase
MLLGRSEDRLMTRAADLRSAGYEVRWLRADVEEPEAMKAAVAATVGTFGGLDILVNCAGRYGPFGPVHRVDPRAWAAVPAMIEGARGGTIINLSGGGASRGRPTFSAYASSKTGIVRLTETIAEELRPYNINVYALAPGGVYTEMTEELLHSAALAARNDVAEAEKIKATGGAAPERIGELAVFLASGAGRSLTGRFISAVWDDWKTISRRVNEDKGLDEYYTLRRQLPPSEEWRM